MTVTSAKKLLVFLASALLAIVTLPREGQAGNGTFKNGVYNFCVSVRFHATDAQLAQIRTAFQNGSQILADATDGQQRFGTITIVNDSGASQSAEYWINSGSGRAYATYGQYGVRGQHVNLFFDSNFQATSGADGDAYTIAHEHSHHSFSVADEYSGTGIADGADCAARPDTATLNFCLMDNYFTRGGRAFGLGYTLGEYCVASNHDPDRNTYQQSINGKSCWETISTHPKRAATAPSGLPVDAAPASQSVTFRTGFGGLRVMLVVDRSGSMSIEQRLVLAKQGANLFVDLLGVGDSLGVASFDCGVSVDFPLTNITGDATRSAAKSAINSLSADGVTNIGGGLQTALDQITSQTDESCNEIIVLLTDGDHNCGTDPNSVIPALQDRGVTVLTIGVGTSISTSGQALLQSIGSQTAGKFYRVANPSDQVAVFFQLSTETTGSGLLTRSPETLTAGQTKEIAVLLETGAESAIFGIGLADSSDQFTLSLKTPSGALITQADAGHPGIEFISESNSRAFRISNPEAGVWKIVVTAGTVTNGKVEAFASAKHDGVQLNLSVTNDALVFPEAAEVHATPTFGGQSVVGATVNGFVVRPDGSTIAITLFDDGTSGHADAVAEDGIYAARFSKYNQNGTYSFTLTALNINGVTYAGENLFAAEQSNESPVTPFTRTSSITAVVTGIPANATDLSISKSASGSPVVSGSNITYTLIVKNNGPNVATSVAITDSLPATTTFASCTATGGGICGGSGNNRTVTFASLDVGASATITLAATVNCSVADGTLINNSATAVSTEPELDPSDNSAEVAFTASNPPPVITGAAASPSELWPPNHKMVNVTISYNVTDNCPLPANACTLSVSSNEPVDGTGDGDTAPDWMVVNTNHVQLRAERAGTGNDRIYTITITCRDSASSSSSQSVTVRVPNNR